MIQPFNYICRITNKCYPIILSYYLPKSTGKERYELFFLTKNFTKNVEFETDARSKVALSGEDVSVIYDIKNLSNHDIKIRPTSFVNPELASKYIKFYECLCFREHKIKKNSQISLVVRFRLDPKIEQDEFFKDNRRIVIGYELK